MEQSLLKTVRSIVSQNPSDFSSYRSSYQEKFIDNPVCFRFHEDQIPSNLHRGKRGRVRPDTGAASPKGASVQQDR